MTSAHDDRYMLCITVNNHTASSRQLTSRWSTGALMSASSIRRHLPKKDLHGGHFTHRTLSTLEPTTNQSSTSAASWTACKVPSWQTTDGGVCSRLMSTEPGKLIGTKLSFQMNHVSICWTMMAVFVLDAMPENSAFQSVLLNDIVIEHLNL